MEKKYTSVGGQAIIEGVMMRSPRFMAIAVRKPDRTILIKEVLWKGFSERFPIFKKPFLRGVATLVESMMNGIEALSFSANVLAEFEEAESKKAEKSPEEKKKTAISNLELFTTIFISFAFGMGLFVALPHIATLAIGKLGVFQHGVENPLFHLIDGLIKVAILVLYILGISLMKDVYRVFQYHGAEHKSIYAFENGNDLTVENAKKYSTQHPRCGTSFLLFLLIISILVFSFIFPFLPKFAIENVILKQAVNIFIKIALMIPVAGISYEFIRATGKCMTNPIIRFLIFPGLMLQNLTTREPNEDQLEVALVSLRRVLLLEKQPELLQTETFEVKSPLEIPAVNAKVDEFLG